MASFEDKIIVTGGVGSEGILKAVNSVLVYNLKTNEWNEGPSMKNARKCHGSHTLNDKLYVVGGTDSQKTVMSTECLEMANLVLKPLRKKGEVIEEAESLWKEEVHQLPSWHNGSSGLVKIGPNKLAALSAYGTDQDKVFDVDTRYQYYLNSEEQYLKFR